MNCRTGCRTKNHASWGDCARAARLQIGDIAGGPVNRKWDDDLNAYASARYQGIQPTGIDRPSIDRAVRISEQTGEAVK